MKLIVGLGNPGLEYACTRHNAGFMVVRLLAVRLDGGGRGLAGVGGGDDVFSEDGLPGGRVRFHSRVLEASCGGQKCLLMQPVTYMNRSGMAVGEAVAFYKVDVGRDLMVVVDDLALPVGAIRVRPGGGTGGHNGLTDVQRALGTEGYCRLRVGVDRSEFAGQKDYLLSRFTESQREDVRAALERACDAVECWVKEGLEAAMNRYNDRRDAGA